ncbi:MAG: YdcF family protein [Bacteroidetes bacterium]|nr:YdcF family protein [Bacteroidota bacterium]
MFFILSKILLYAVMPLVVICGLLIVSFFLKKESLKKKCRFTALAMLLFFTNDFINNEVMRLWEIPVTKIQDIKKTYTYGIILAGVTRYDTGPPDRVYFNCGADRVTHTLQLYKLGIIKKILVSGGSGRVTAPEQNEALEIASVLQLMGVPVQDIVIEGKSRNTHESAVAVKRLLGNTTPEECILITSAFHMRRSLACFEKIGWKTDCFSVDFLSHHRQFTLDVLIVPSVESLMRWHTLVKEWVGMAVYKLMGYS